jgi:RNA recognition motif-containing protein
MDEENALAAIEGLDGTELGGRSLNVKKSLPKGEKAVAKGKPWDMKFVLFVFVCLLIIHLFSYITHSLTIL